MYGFVRSLPPRKPAKSVQGVGKKRERKKSEMKGGEGVKGRERKEGREGRESENSTGERAGKETGRGVGKGGGDADDQTPSQPPLGKWSKVLSRLEKTWAAYKVNAFTNSKTLINKECTTLDRGAPTLAIHDITTTPPSFRHP